VHQESIGNPGKTQAGLVVVDRLRFLAAIARSHDQRPAEGIEQEMMERRCGQHHAQMILPRRQSVGQGFAPSARHGKRTMGAAGEASKARQPRPPRTRRLPAPPSP
jgi:hypothetical protein